MICKWYFYVQKKLYAYSQIFSALLTGNIEISAEKRTTLRSWPDADDTSSNSIENSDDVKVSMMHIIDIAIIGNGLEKLWTK